MKVADVEALVSKDSLSLNDLLGFQDNCAIDEEFKKEVEDLATSDEKRFAKLAPDENKAKIRKAALYWVRGMYERAMEILTEAHKSKEVEALKGLTHFQSGRYLKALEIFKSLYDGESSNQNFLLMYIECLARTGDVDAAATEVARFEKKIGENENLYYLKGLVSLEKKNYDDAERQFKKALQINANHAGSLLELAFLAERWGEDDEAFGILENLLKIKPVRSSALMNLGLCYEDRNDFTKAIQCYNAVLTQYPGLKVAKLYLHDALESQKMFYDEEQLKRAEKEKKLAAIHISDLRLTKPLINALQKARIYTLADLLHKPEEDLAKLPGVGIARLKEIKEALNARGLSLASKKERELQDYFSKVNPVLLNKPLSEIDWKQARARKLMSRLGLVTVKDLIKYSETELRSQSNVGETTIQDIRERLSELGIELRKE